jgi:hypothetical protein
MHLTQQLGGDVADETFLEVATRRARATAISVGARENSLPSVASIRRCRRKPSGRSLPRHSAKILAWQVWQMSGSRVQ